jgi:hypothetical protein
MRDEKHRSAFEAGARILDLGLAYREPLVL